MFVLHGCGVCYIVTNACVTDACGNDTWLSGIYFAMHDVVFVVSDNCLSCMDASFI